MNRREFCLGTLAVTAGCSAGDNEMPQEYLLQPSPAKRGAELNSGVPGYFEGKWTPSVGGDATYLLQTGFFTKIGNWVFFTGRLSINVLGTGSTLSISGLPYISKIGTSQIVAVSCFFNGATAVVEIKGEISTQATSITLLTRTAAQIAESVVNPVFQDGAKINLSGAYMVDD